MKFFRITTNIFEGAVRIYRYLGVVEKPKTIYADRKVFKKSEMDKITDYHCYINGQKAIYTSDEEKIPGYVEMLRSYYKERWESQIEELKNRIANLDQPETIKEIRKD